MCHISVSRDALLVQIPPPFQLKNNKTTSMKKLSSIVKSIEWSIDYYQSFQCPDVDAIATIARVAKENGHPSPENYAGWDSEYIMKCLPSDAPTDRPFTRFGRWAEKAARAYYSSFKPERPERTTPTLHGVARMASSFSGLDAYEAEKAFKAGGMKEGYDLHHHTYCGEFGCASLYLSEVEGEIRYKFL